MRTADRRKNYQPWVDYGQSKLANVLFTYELIRRLPSAANCTVNALHPGVVNTELARYLVDDDPPIWQVQSSSRQRTAVMSPLRRSFAPFSLAALVQIFLAASRDGSGQLCVARSNIRWLMLLSASDAAEAVDGRREDVHKDPFSGEICRGTRNADVNETMPFPLSNSVPIAREETPDDDGGGDDYDDGVAAAADDQDGDDDDHEDGGEDEGEGDVDADGHGADDDGFDFDDVITVTIIRMTMIMKTSTILCDVVMMVMLMPLTMIMMM
jgi:hypothetical protein